MSRERPDAPFVVLAACGICQERLAYWGDDVQVGVPDPDDATRWLSLPLREVQPHYWAKHHRLGDGVTLTFEKSADWDAGDGQRGFAANITVINETARLWRC